MWHQLCIAHWSLKGRACLLCFVNVKNTILVEVVQIEQAMQVNDVTHLHVMPGCNVFQRFAKTPVPLNRGGRFHLLHDEVRKLAATPPPSLDLDSSGRVSELHHVHKIAPSPSAVEDSPLPLNLDRRSFSEGHEMADL